MNCNLKLFVIYYTILFIKIRCNTLNLHIHKRYSCLTTFWKSVWISTSISWWKQGWQQHLSGKGGQLFLFALKTKYFQLLNNNKGNILNIDLLYFGLTIVWCIPYVFFCSCFPSWLWSLLKFHNFSRQT